MNIFVHYLNLNRQTIMNHIFKTITGAAIFLAIIISGCSNNPRTSKNQDSVILESERGEHNRDIQESGGEEGEEGGIELKLDEVYDEVRNGARLVLSYDVQSNSFNGTVENTTDEILERVRVEVHLSSGIELGPTIPTDLKPGEKRAVKLNATDSDFERWSAHAESGSSEPGHSGEGEEGEHSGEGEEGEHSSERD